MVRLVSRGELVRPRPNAVLKKLRADRAITQADLAFVIGVGQMTVSAWERGTSQPTARNTLALAAYFEVSPDLIVPPEGRAGLVRARMFLSVFALERDVLVGELSRRLLILRGK